jgi:hypothetical protein
MKQRNFVVGVAYSKTDALQVALFAALFLGELPRWATAVSHRLMNERLTRAERAGLVLVCAGLAVLSAAAGWR